MLLLNTYLERIQSDNFFIETSIHPPIVESKYLHIEINLNFDSI